MYVEGWRFERGDENICPLFLSRSVGGFYACLLSPPQRGGGGFKSKAEKSPRKIYRDITPVQRGRARIFQKSKYVFSLKNILASLTNNYQKLS